MAELLNSIEQQNNFSNFQYFLQFKKQILEYIPKHKVNLKSNNKPLVLRTLEELFEFLEVNFLKFYEIKTFEAVLPFIHSSLEKWFKNWDKLSSDIGITLLYLLEMHTGDETEITIVVKIINSIVNFLKSMENSKDIKISRKVFVKLAEILPTIRNGKLASEVVSYLQYYIEMYPDNQRDIIQSLWLDLSQRLIVQTSGTVSTNRETDILAQFYDEFYLIKIAEDATVIATIHQLLISEQKVSRKTGYYLCRKMMGYLVKKLKK